MSTQPVTRSFHVGDLLSVTDGRLVSPDHIAGVYRVIDFVTGEEHMTHQLPRASRVVGPWILNQHPWLADVEFDFDIPDSASSDEARGIVAAWLANAAAKHGERHDVEQMPLGMYVGRDPIAELSEMAPHAEIIVLGEPGL